MAASPERYTQLVTKLDWESYKKWLFSNKHREYAHKLFGSLDTVFMPIERRISRWKSHFPVDLRRRQIINYLIEDFQRNPIHSDNLDPYWYNSNIPHFLNDLHRIFSNDLDVIRLLQIPKNHVHSKLSYCNCYLYFSNIYLF